MRATMWKMMIVGACAATALGGCASHRGSARDTSEPDTPPRAAAGPAKAIPAASPLAKIQMGMGMNEVRDLIGPPTDTHSAITGKAFIPYYHGDDAARVQWHYKGLGRVVFNAGGNWGQRAGVASVEYDPSEPGYYRAQ